MKTILNTGSLMIGAIAGVMALSTSAVATASHAKSNGEIVGIVEMGSTRISDAVVSLTEVPGTFAPPAAGVTMDQKDKQFLPHVLAIVKGSKVKFNNSDPFFHNVFSSSRIKMFNVSQEKKGDISELVFEKAGLIPIRCHIHANMKAYIVVLPNPYFAVTTEKGQFQIGDVPPGTYTMKVWSEKATGSTQTVEVTSGGRAKAIFKISQ